MLHHIITWCSYHVLTQCLYHAITWWLYHAFTLCWPVPNNCNTLPDVFVCMCKSTHDASINARPSNLRRKWLAQIAVPTQSPCGLLKIAGSLGCASAASAAYTSSALCAHPLSPCAEPLLPCLQLRGHGSYSELAEVEGSRRYLKVLLAEDNLINMKVDTLLRLLLLQHLSTTTSATPAF